MLLRFKCTTRPRTTKNSRLALLFTYRLQFYWMTNRKSTMPPTLCALRSLTQGSWVSSRNVVVKCGWVNGNGPVRVKTSSNLSGTTTKLDPLNEYRSWNILCWLTCSQAVKLIPSTVRKRSRKWTDYCTPCPSVGRILRNGVFGNQVQERPPDQGDDWSRRRVPVLRGPFSRGGDYERYDSEPSITNVRN